MKKERRKIYVKVSPEKNEVIYSGIEFAEFIQYLTQPIDNLLLLKGDYFGNRCEHNFELLEGREIVEKLTREDVHNFGDFCFVDYISPQKVNDLSEEQIAELLYLGHMFRPLRSPFLEQLHNKFVYLAHDNGWYCKLYCRNLSDFITVLCKKITANIPIKNMCEPSDDVKEKMLELAKDGLLIDLNDLSRKSENVEIKFYIVGSYSDMDTIQNNFQQIRDNALRVCSFKCNKNGWE